VGRLYHRGRARFSDRLVHERLIVDGTTRDLRHPLLHLTYRSFGQYMAKAQRYAEQGARELARQGRRPRPWTIATAPLGRFLRTYLLQAGFLDGTAGFMVAFVAAYGVFARYAYLREILAAEREEVAREAIIGPPEKDQRASGERNGG
jgi:hypothetical protein